MEVVLVDQKPFLANIKMIEAMYYIPEFQLITWPPKSLKMPFKLLISPTRVFRSR